MRRMMMKLETQFKISHDFNDDAKNGKSPSSDRNTRNLHTK